MVGQVVAFAVGGHAGRCGQPGTGVGRVGGAWAERPSELERPVVVGEVEPNLLPPAADQLSCCTCELELLVAARDWR